MTMSMVLSSVGSHEILIWWVTLAKPFSPTLCFQLLFIVQCVETTRNLELTRLVYSSQLYQSRLTCTTLVLQISRFNVSESPSSRYSAVHNFMV